MSRVYVVSCYCSLEFWENAVQLVPKKDIISAAHGHHEYSDALEPVNPLFRASDNTPHYESLE